jgi:hypothetical protein
MSQYIRLDTSLAPSDSPALLRLAANDEPSVIPLIGAIPNAPANGLAPPLARKRLQVFMAMMLADIAILLGCFGAFSFAYLIAYRGLVSMDAAMLPAYLLLPIFLTIGLFNGTYSGGALTRWPQAAWRVASALVVAAALFNFVAFFAKMSEDFSRAAFALSVISSLLLMALLRVLLVGWVARSWSNGPINRLLILAGGPKVDLPGLHTIDAAEHGILPRLDDPRSLHRLAKYLRNMDEVMVSCPEGERAAWSQVLKGAGIHAEVVSPMAQEIGALGIRHYGEGNFSTLLISTGALRMRDRALKRLFDIGLSVAGLIVLSPLLLVTACAILFDDGAPVLFRQQRMGRGNHLFAIAKFRSIKSEQSDAGGERSASLGDTRVTRVGHFIRRTSIDELPQLWNVLRGDMSTIAARLPAPKPDIAVHGGGAGGAAGGQARPKAEQRSVIGRILWLAGLAALALVACLAQLDRAARSQPALAVLVPSLFRGFAAQRLTEQAIAAEDGVTALREARLLVRARPLPAEHMRLLSQAAALKGDSPLALAAMEAATSRGWRDPLAQLAAGQSALLQGRFDAAAQRIGALFAVGALRCLRRCWPSPRAALRLRGNSPIRPAGRTMV